MNHLQPQNTPDVQSWKPPVPSINFHLWKPCNFRCKFCFATFNDHEKGFLPKGHLPREQALEIVREIGQNGFEKLTFAGGEPLMCAWLPELILEAKKFNMTTMVVTNGSFLTEEWLDKISHSLDWITLSIDSLVPKTNVDSGRATVTGNHLSEADYLEKITWIKARNIRFKMNTVVHSLNHAEDLNGFIEQAKPERWKIFQALPMDGQNDGRIEELLIGQKDFDTFIENHSPASAWTEVVPENNDEMTSSYLMVDPAGRFYDNEEGRHRYSRPILDFGLKVAIQDISISEKKFLDRGGSYDWERESPPAALPQKIILSGLAGSGKSSVGKELARQLGYPFRSAGDIARKEAARRGITIEALQTELVQDPAYDKKLDRELVEWGQENEAWVMDYRMGFAFLPEATSIFLHVDAEEAVQRILVSGRKGELAAGAQTALATKSVRERNENMRNRLFEIYSKDFTDPEGYHYLVETTNRNIQETVAEIIRLLRS